MEQTMKRFVFLILSICLCLTFSLSGCSCTGDSILEFNSTNVKSIQSDRLTYSVTLEQNYKDIKRASGFNLNLLPEYKNGLYVAEYQTGVSCDNNQINLSSSESVINLITTNLTIDVVDTKGTADTSDDVTYKDQILSEVYFYDSTWSYAPIYSKTTVKNTYVANDETRIEFSHKIYQYTTTYKKSSFTTVKKYYAEADGEDITGALDLTKLDQDKFVTIKGNGGGGTAEYDFRHVIDNVQLMFAIRNLSISKGSSLLLPTVTYMYSNPCKLQISNSSVSTFNFETELNYARPNYTNVYAEDTLTMPVKNMRIMLAETDYSGLPKYLVLQNDSADNTNDNPNIKNNNLIVEYAEPVISNSSYDCLGALVYRLNGVNLTYSN